jgi:3-methyladenine DNA glycosylase AlkC
MAEPLKNMYNHRFVETLAAHLSAVYTGFDSTRFITGIFDEAWEGRELKARMRHITHTLHGLLPEDYRIAISILRDVSARMTGFSFETMIFPDFVEVYGLADWDASLPALEQFTQQSSAEFAVRPFILVDSERMMAQMQRWAEHPSHHVRRLASEGCRPRLPWAVALPAFKRDPAPILPILERLKEDESEYVRRSVANNLNDIAKDNPHITLEVLRRWSEVTTPQMRQMVTHAARTLIKAGNSEALSLLGYAATPIKVTHLTVEPAIVPSGGEMTFSFDLTLQGDAPCDLMIDYVIHLVRSGGKRTPKVFKLSKVRMQPEQSMTIRRKHSFRPITTRVYYPGEHLLEIQINGEKVARTTFLLE